MQRQWHARQSVSLAYFGSVREQNNGYTQGSRGCSLEEDQAEGWFEGTGLALRERLSGKIHHRQQ